MPSVKRVSIVDLTAEHLRAGVLSGRWKVRLPGLRKLADELSVSRESLRQALARLVDEGLLLEGGENEAHTIVSGITPCVAGSRALRVALLFMRGPDAEDPSGREILRRMENRLNEDGHTCLHVSVPVNKDPHKTGYLRKLVDDTGADAWLIQHGTVEVLEWFSQQPVPSLALGGRCIGLPIAAAGLDSSSVTRESVRRLAALGHRRIVTISCRNARLPTPGDTVRAFREELEAAGVRTGSYHTPDWEETPEGLDTLLDALFKVTPPTALLCPTVSIAMGTLAFLRQRGLRVPADVSIIAMHGDPHFGWIIPGLQVVRMDDGGLDHLFLRRVRRWVAGVANGEPDRAQLLESPTLAGGNSIGPPKPD